MSPEAQEKKEEQNGIITVTIEGHPKFWAKKYKDQFLELEEESYSVYHNEKDDKMEGSSFWEDFFVERPPYNERLFSPPNNPEEIITRFYYKADQQKPFAFSNFVVVSIPQPQAKDTHGFNLHGVTLPSNRGLTVLSVRKVMHLPSLTEVPPHWNDIFATVSRLTEKYGDLYVAQHLQPDSLNVVEGLGWIDAHAAHPTFTDPPEVELKERVIAMVNNGQSVKEILHLLRQEETPQEKYRVARNILRAAPLAKALPHQTFTFIPDDETVLNDTTKRSGNVIVHFNPLGKE